MSVLLAIDAFRPPLGWAMTLTAISLTLVAALALYISVRRRDAIGDVFTRPQRVALAALRIAGIAALAWLLLGPTVWQESGVADRPVSIVLLADTSASMNERDVLGPAGAGRAITRWDALRDHWLSPQFLDQLRARGEPRVLGFDATVHPLAPDQLATMTPGGQATRVLSAVDESIASSSTEPPGVLILLSDGHDTQRPIDDTAAAHLAATGWRIFAVPVGASRSVRDVSLITWPDADALFAGQSTTINATLSQVGYEHQTATVDLVEAGRVIATDRVNFDDNLSATVKFPVTPQPVEGQAIGVRGYEVVVHPMEGERALENNRRWVFVQVQKDRIKVALLEGRPYWDTKYLDRVLRDDAQVDLTTIYSLGAGRMVATTRSGAAPADLTAGWLRQQDIVVLGKGAEEFFSGDKAQLLVDFVNAGGNLVLARGQPFDGDNDGSRTARSILAPIEPVTWGTQTLANLGLDVTPAGQSSPLLQFDKLGDAAVITRMPDMLAATRVERENAASIVLLRQSPRGDATNGSPGMAALAYRNAGKGKVLAILSDGLWRWSLLPTRLKEFDSIYQVFWARTVRWLAGGGEFLPGQSVSLQLSKLTAEPDDQVTVTVSTRYVAPDDFHPMVRFTTPDGKFETVTLARAGDQSNRYTGTIKPTEPGVSTVTLDAPGMTPASLSTRLAVYDQSIERLDPSARPESLAAIAKATGGECLPLDGTQQLLDRLGQLATSRIVQREPRYALDGPLVVAVVGFCFGVEWFLRRRWGAM